MADIGDRPSREEREAAAAAEGLPHCPISICPVGMAVTLGGEVRPEVVEHLLAAGRELLLAAKAFMDARVDSVPGPDSLEKIEVE